MILFLSAFYHFILYCIVIILASFWSVAHAITDHPVDQDQDLADHLTNLNLGETVWTPQWVRGKLRDTSIQKSPKISYILIPYRNDGQGKGAFYDHFTLQKLTDHPTAFDPNPKELKNFHAYLEDSEIELPFNSGNDTEAPNLKRLGTPSRIEDVESRTGLLVIAGRLRVLEDDSTQNQREDLWIKKARNRGQPILALCAGSWRLWEAYQGKCKPVHDHCYGGGMLRLSPNGQVKYNAQIHGVELDRDSLVSRAMTENGTETEENLIFMVNSVHWKSVDDSEVPQELKVIGRSVKLDDICIKTRQGTRMSPESATVEAFESSWGAPTVGIQWHPEGYNLDDQKHHQRKNSQYFKPAEQIRLLRYLAQAGDAYAHKRGMILQLRQLADLCSNQSHSESHNH